MPSSENNDLKAQIETLMVRGDVGGIVKLFAAVEAKAADLANRLDAAEEDVRHKDMYIKQLVRLLYGRKTEKLNQNDLRQLFLALGGDEADNAEDPSTPIPDEPAPSSEASEDTTKRKRPNHKGRGKLSANLERIVKMVDVPETERNCKCCGKPMKSLGRVDHETVEHIPEKFVVHVESRETLACSKCDGDIKTAPRQSEGDVRVGSSVLATLLDGKGEDALPVYRQADRCKRLGWNVPYNTLLGYWAYGAELLVPVSEATVSKILDDYVVSIDDTSLDVLGNRQGDKKFRGHLWCFTNTGPLTGFRFAETWNHKEIEPWVNAITGFIQTDDYKGYSANVQLADGSEGPLIANRRRIGCMMHVRRRFYEAFALKDKRAAKPVDLIKRIYEVEATAKKQQLSPDDRLNLRQEHSLPLLKELYDILECQQHALGNTSKYAKAVKYAIAQKEFIERCFSDGRFEIDNGKTEREIRRPAVGRKNFLFTGSVRGGQRVAAVYTLILSCRNLGIDTRAYLIDVLDKLRAGWPLRRLSELIPDNWARLHGSGPSAA